MNGKTFFTLGIPGTRALTVHGQSIISGIAYSTFRERASSRFSVCVTARTADAVLELRPELFFFYCKPEITITKGTAEMQPESRFVSGRTPPASRGYGDHS